MTLPSDVLETTVLAVDPGSVKCGVAVVRRVGSERHALYQAVVARADLEAEVHRLCTQYRPKRVLVGNATQSRAIVARLRGVLDTLVPIETVDEAYTTDAARRRYLRENAPTGRDLYQRLLPLSLRTPPRPIDDYVALILAERWLDAPANADSGA